MGKANKVKGELVDAVEMTFLVQTLKDIADSKLFTLMSQKYKFRRFGESFVEFFRMISLTKEEHPLIKNNNPKVGVLVITIDGGFLGQFNSKIIRNALYQKEKYENVTFMGVGDKSQEILRRHTPDMKLFPVIEMHNLYETAMEIKDYVVTEVMEGRLGKILVSYSWPKNFDVQIARVFQILPCEELISKQTQFVDEFENVIQESDSKTIIGFLVNVWITTRIYEILMDTIIASAAAQVAFLEEAVERMKKEREKVRVKFRKARKNDIDKSLRETFSARMLSTK